MAESEEMSSYAAALARSIEPDFGIDSFGNSGNKCSSLGLVWLLPCYLRWERAVCISLIF